jgi:aspartate/methionine/tyrosine aminotransferase
MNDATEFLPWIKDLYASLHGRVGCYDLMNSGIREPTDLLGRLLFEQQEELRSRVAQSSEWGHPALVAGLRRRHAIPADKEMLITAGATAGFWLACQATLSPGDRVLAEAPVYEPLRLVPARLGAAIDTLPRRPEAGYRLDLEELAARMTPRTRLVILTSLHNPSGAVLSKEELVAAAEAARSGNPEALVLVDETFLAFAGETAPSSAHLGPAFITVNTLTKVYGLGQLRCGWVVASPEIMHRIRRDWISVAGIGSRLTEALASMAVDQLDLFEAHEQAVLAGNRPLMQKYLGPLVKAGLLRGEVVPAGCICFPEVVGAGDTEELARALASEQGAFVVPGRFFGAPGHIRLGFGGDPAVLSEGLERLADFLLARRP